MLTIFVQVLRLRLNAGVRLENSFCAETVFLAFSSLGVIFPSQLAGQRYRHLLRSGAVGVAKYFRLLLLPKSQSFVEVLVGPGGYVEVMPVVVDLGDRKVVNASFAAGGVVKMVRRTVRALLHQKRGEPPSLRAQCCKARPELLEMLSCGLLLLRIDAKVEGRQIHMVVGKLSRGVRVLEVGLGWIASKVDGLKAIR